MEKPHIWSADKHRHQEKGRFVEDFGDVGYGVGLGSLWKGDSDR